MCAENNTRLSKQHFHFSVKRDLRRSFKKFGFDRFYPLVLVKGSTVFKERSVYCISRAKWLIEYFWKIFYDNTCGHRRACITPKALNLLHAFSRRRQAKEKIHQTVGCWLCLAVTMECWRHMIHSVTCFKDNSTAYFCERGAAFPYSEEVVTWLATTLYFHNLEVLKSLINHKIKDTYPMLHKRETV